MPGCGHGAWLGVIIDHFSMYSGEHLSTPGFEATHIIYFGRSLVVLSSGSLTAALRSADTGLGLEAARSRAVPCSLPLLGYVPHEGTQPSCLLGVLGFFF